MNNVATQTTFFALSGVLLLLLGQSPVADEPAAEPGDDIIVAPPATAPPPDETPGDVTAADTAEPVPAPVANTEEVVKAEAQPTGDSAIASDHADADAATDILEPVEAAATAEGPDVGPVILPQEHGPTPEEFAAQAPADELSESPGEPGAPDPSANDVEVADAADHGAVEGSAPTEDLLRNATGQQTEDAPTASPGNSTQYAGVAIDPLSAEMDEPSSEIPLADAVTIAEEQEAARTMTLLNAEVPPGTYQRLSWSATELFEGIPVSTPVLAVNGKLPGPTLCLTAAVHGDELNGIEMVRRVMHDLDPQKLSGAVIGVPIVNLQGFRRGSRYLPDRRDLNRYFPGNPNGSAASRIAHSFFTEVIRHCDALIDLHTGSFERANLPQLRADLRNPDVVTLTHGFGATVILHSDPTQGTLRHAASRVGIATVTLEAGGPSELELKEVMHGVKGIETLLNTLGMVKKARLWGDPEPVYYRSVWVRADRGGILLADVSLGSTVRRGDLLGTITDPMNNASTNLYAPFAGRVIGMARNQVVMPGFAAFHVGIQTAEARAADNREDDTDDALMHESEVTNDDYIDGMSE
ncbi:MAG: succinylglutamate desuccinylase/aspartoacylase family protein [Woeseia sp.]